MNHHTNIVRELQHITGGDVNLARGVLVVRKGKANRVDEVPLHPDLAAELTRERPRTALPSAKVFPTAVSNTTRRKDFMRAEIPETDEDGRYADLHALRSTLGTMLARAGVTPQVAQKVMRHSDYRTTIRFYTKLGLSDTAAAVHALPSPTGGTAKPKTNPHHQPHHSGDETVLSGAS
jgi:integrase